MTDPIRVRASSLAEIFDCPARWQSIHLEGGGPKFTSGPAQLGTAIHAGTGAYDQAALEGAPITAEDAVDIAIATVRKPELEVRYDDQLSKGDAVNLAAMLTTRYIDVIAPQVVYEAVELQCESMVVSFQNGIRIELTGTVDRVRAVGDARGISDLKSGRAVVRNGAVAVEKHIAQLGTYELLEVMAKQTTGTTMVLPAQIIALPTSGDAAPALGEVTRPSRILFGNEKHAGLLDVAAQMFKTGLFYGNPKSVLCGAKYCPAYKTCWWRGVTTTTTTGEKPT